MSLHALPVQLDQQMQYLYIDTDSERVGHQHSSLPVCDPVETGYITSLLSNAADSADSSSGSVNINGDTTPSAQHTCRSVAHALFFADTYMGTLNKIHLFPINPVEVFVPSVLSVKSSTPKYTSVFHAQEQVNPTLNTLSQGVVLLQGMEKIQGFALDLKSRYVVVLCFFDIFAQDRIGKSVRVLFLLFPA